MDIQTFYQRVMPGFVRSPVKQRLESSSGKEVFAEPLAWALAWDGSALSEAVKPQNGYAGPRGETAGTEAR